MSFFSILVSLYRCFYFDCEYLNPCSPSAAHIHAPPVWPRRKPAKNSSELKGLPARGGGNDCRRRATQADARRTVEVPRRCGEVRGSVGGGSETVRGGQRICRRSLSTNRHHPNRRHPRQLKPVSALLCSCLIRRINSFA
jgi:hypothetical protein